MDGCRDKKQFIFFYFQGEEYKKWASQATASFKQYHDMDVVVISSDDDNYNSNIEHKHIHPSIRRLGVALEHMEKHQYEKVIISGVDIITCHSYDEFIDSSADITVTYDFYGKHKVEFLNMTAETYCNSDLMAFTSREALKDVFERSFNNQYKAQYREQHALNEVILENKYSVDYVEDTGVFYNLRALAPGDVRQLHYTQQYKQFIPQMYIKDEKLYRFDGALIKAFHFGDTIEKYNSQNLQTVLKEWKSMFKPEVLEFLITNCKGELLDV